MIITMMMIRSNSENPQNEPIIPSTSPIWKLYENPFFTSPFQQKHKQENQQVAEEEKKQIHRVQLPISTSKIAASFWDLTFIRPVMESELDIARAQIVELKAQLECERKARKKLESANKKLAKQLSGQRKGGEALEKLCEEFAKEISSDKAEMSKMTRDMEEERKMLRVAEVLREERVQMKLAEAKILLEEKLFELEAIKKTEIESFKNVQENNLPRFVAGDSVSNSAQPKTTVLGENCNSNSKSNSIPIQRRVSLEPENPHIKRGIKGFVEFPKVVRAIGSRSRHLGTKLECQKAQLMILLKHRNPIRSGNLILS